MTVVVIGSVAAASYGLSAVNPVDGQTVAAQSLMSSENLRRLFVDMPRTLTGFAPLGYVLVVMLNQPKSCPPPGIHDQADSPVR